MPGVTSHQLCNGHLRLRVRIGDTCRFGMVAIGRSPPINMHDPPHTSHDPPFHPKNSSPASLRSAARPFACSHPRSPALPSAFHFAPHPAEVGVYERQNGQDSKMENIKFARCHSRKSKSVSVLPPHPELDPALRRSGIRHFSHVPSLRKAPAPTTGVRKFSNFGKFKAKRAVSEFAGPTNFRNRLNSEDGQALEETTKMEERALCDVTLFEGNRDRMRAARRPVPGKGRFVELAEEGVGSELTYPYPQHLPAAAARPQRVYPPVLPCQHHFATPAQPQPTAQTAQQGPQFTVKEAFNVLMGIGVAIIALFMWIFRTEVVTFGLVFGITFLGFNLGQWHTRTTMEKRENELIQQGRLLPEPQQLPTKPGVASPSRQPAGYIGW